MDTIGVRAKELYDENINEFVKNIRFILGEQEDAVEKKYIEEYEEVVCDFVNYMLAAFPDERLNQEAVNYWVTQGANLSFEKLYKQYADKIFLKRNMTINGTVFINSGRDINMPKFTVKEGRITGIDNLSSLILAYSHLFKVKYRLNVNERHFLGRNLEEVYDELQSLGVIEENSELKRIITIYEVQREMFKAFHASVIYTLLMQGHGIYDARRALLFDKFVNLAFDFEQIYERNYILSLYNKYESKTGN